MLYKTAPFVVYLFLCFFSSASAQDIFKEEANLYSTHDLINNMKCPRESKIVIKSASTLRGKIVISTSSDEICRVIYTKKAKTDSQSRAIDYIDLIAVSTEKIPGGVKLEIRAPNPAPWQGTELGIVNAELIIPDMCAVEIEALYFDIEAYGPFKNFIVPSSLGRFEVKKVTEKLELATSNRRIALEDISGDINVATTNSTIIADNITSKNHKTVFRNDGGDIKLNNISGELNVKNSYGRIDISNFEPDNGKNYIRNDNGPIIMSIVKIDKAQLLISNRFEDIEINVPSHLSAELSLAVEDEGKVEVTNFPFKPNLIQRNRLNLITGKGDALLNCSIRGRGNIYVRAQ